MRYANFDKGCCCTYKGNQIFANHNDIALDDDFNALLLYLQR